MQTVIIQRTITPIITEYEREERVLETQPAGSK